jgi:hypothetical protein
MKASNIFRRDPTNVGDWHCAPTRYFRLQGGEGDILEIDKLSLAQDVVVGGGGLIAKTFHPHMEKLASRRGEVKTLVAWGIGESENVDRSGGFVRPYDGDFPAYLDAFDLVGVRDFGTRHRWVPCASCMSDVFDRQYPVSTEICVYEHKRIPLPIGDYPRMNNAEEDLHKVARFLASAKVVITNSYHGAYWATLLGRSVVVIPSMSKLYRFAHPPVICRMETWKNFVSSARSYPNALAECRGANIAFSREVLKLQAA